MNGGERRRDGTFFWASGAGGGNSGAAPGPGPLVDAPANWLLKLDDPQLERAYWDQPQSATGVVFDFLSCLLGIFLSASHVLDVHRWLAAHPGSLLAPGLRHWVYLQSGTALASAAAAASPALALLRGGAPARRPRAAVNAALRTLRLALHAWASVFTESPGLYWHQRVVYDAPHPWRSLSTALAGIPTTYMALGLMDPVPISPFMPVTMAAAAVIYVCGWLPVAASVWSHPRRRDAAAALCGWLHWGAVLARCAVAAPLRWPPDCDPSELDAAPSPAACCCLLSALGIALTASFGIALPACVVYQLEKASKGDFLRSRGRQLRMRAPWARGAARAAPTALQAAAGRWRAAAAAWWRLGGPAPVAVCALLGWQLADLAAAALQPALCALPGPF